MEGGQGNLPGGAVPFIGFFTMSLRAAYKEEESIKGNCMNELPQKEECTARFRAQKVQSSTPAKIKPERALNVRLKIEVLS